MKGNAGSPARRRRLGQHFLHDSRVIARIVAAIAPAGGAQIIEIGPGRGALTVPLLEAAGALHVVEVDRRLAEQLPALCAGRGQLRVHRVDALEFDLAEAGRGPFKIVGNLPYSVSTPLLFHLLEQLALIEEMVFMLQKEVVDRMAAGPGSRDYGRLSVMVQSQCAVTRLFTVAPGAFTPPPKVESAVLRLVPEPGFASRVRNAAAFDRVVRAAFQQRRKMLRASLRTLSVDTESLLREAGIDGRLRPEQLSVSDFENLANVLSQR